MSMVWVFEVFLGDFIVMIVKYRFAKVCIRPRVCNCLCHSTFKIWQQHLWDKESSVQAFFLWWHYMDKQAILPCGFYFKIRPVLFTFTCQNNSKSMTLSQFESKLVAATAVAYSTSFQRLKCPHTKTQPTSDNTCQQFFMLFCML